MATCQKITKETTGFWYPLVSGEKDLLNKGEMKITEFNQAKSQFYDYFKVGINRFHDVILSIAFQKITLDITEFDSYLHQQFGEYEERNLSLKDIVINNYGLNAYEFLEELI